MDDLSFIQSPDQLTLGLGTLLYTGPDVEIPGFQFKAAAGRPAVFESASDVTVGTIKRTGTSTFLKLGTGTLRLHGTDTLAVNTSQNNSGTGSSPRFANGDGPTKAVRGFAVSDGTFIIGEVGDPANAPTLDINSREIGVGNYTSPNNSKPTLILNNGTISLTSQFYLSFYSRSGTEQTFKMNGGRIVSTGGLRCDYYGAGATSTHSLKSSLFEVNGGNAFFGGSLNMGCTAAKNPGTATSRLVVNGGTLAFGGEAVFAFSPFGRTSDIFVDLNGGLFAVTGETAFASHPGDKVTLRLNSGGTFRADAVTHTNAVADAKFYGNGGTFQPICKTTAGQTLNSAFTLYSSTNGLVVDTSEAMDGAAYTIAMPIMTDPDCEGADGGLVKRGKGVLALSSADHTFTGPARVEGGVLKVDAAAALANTMVELAGGGLAVGSGMATVGGLAGGGIVQGGDLAVTGALAPAANQDGYFYLTGALTVADRAVLDVSAFDDGEIAPGDRLFIAAAEGPITVPTTLRVRPAEKLSQPGLLAKTVVADGCLYVTVSSGGTAIIIR